MLGFWKRAVVPTALGGAWLKTNSGPPGQRGGRRKSDGGSSTRPYCSTRPTVQPTASAAPRRQRAVEANPDEFDWEVDEWLAHGDAEPAEDPSSAGSTAPQLSWEQLEALAAPGAGSAAAGPPLSWRQIEALARGQMPRRRGLRGSRVPERRQRGHAPRRRRTPTRRALSSSCSGDGESSGDPPLQRGVSAPSDLLLVSDLRSRATVMS